MLQMCAKTIDMSKNELNDGYYRLLSELLFEYSIYMEVLTAQVINRIFCHL